MNRAPFHDQPDEVNHPIATGLSRRKALKLLFTGSVSALLVEAAQPTELAQAQTIYIPSLSNGANAQPETELCSDDPECLEEECCLTTAELDFTWFRTHLLDQILPKWLAAVTSQGLFLPHFDRQWHPLNRNFGTLVSQCRLLYNFAQGYALTGEARYRNAVAGGAHFLLDHFRDTRNGGWYWSCNLNGSVRDRAKDSYGHAFVIFGLAHAYDCTANNDFREAMLDAWDVMSSRLRDSYGGFHGRMSEDFKVTENSKTQNPLMHTFEALLAAGTVGGEAQLNVEARTVGNFVLDNLVRRGDRRLPEIYDMQWAYLASYGAELGLPARFLNYANSFLNYAMALGFDWQEGGLYSPAAPNGVLNNQEKGWWEQCETIRALTHFYLRHNRGELSGPLQKMLEFVKASFIDPQYGGWYGRVGPGINPQSLEKGNEWKVDYHVVGMCMEAIRLTA